MNFRFILAGFAALLIATSAQGQDLKPVRDKSTKLYGYQDKSKNWVVEPAYESAKRFKDGLAEVTIKQDKLKYHGLIDESGRVVIPVECRTVSINQKGKLIYAEKAAEHGYGWMWGVYDYAGNEIWAPQFSAAPVFYDGRGVARSCDNGLKGVIDLNGRVLLPFDYLAVERLYDGYEVLTKDFVRKVFDGHLNRASEYAYPGYVMPYDPAGDPVRAAAWHVGPIGYRLHRNNLKAVQSAPGKWNSSATCSTLRIDWGDARFVRLEPAVDEDATHTYSMLDPFSGRHYTVKAVLCESDGTFVEDLAKWGWIEGEYAEGIIYNAEGRETWMVMRDINCPAMPSFTTPLTRSRTIDHGDVINGLGLHSYDLENMYNPERYADRAVKILTGENAGITYRLPPEAPGIRMSRTINEIHRTPLFRRRFRSGDIVNCKVHPSEGGVELELSDNLVCRYEDNFTDPSFRMESDEVLFWGPFNEYTVVLSARQAPRGGDFIKDDVYGSDSSFEIALELYDGFDRYLQTIAVVPRIDYIADGWMVLEKEGIAIRLRSMDFRPDGKPGQTTPSRQPVQPGSNPSRQPVQPGSRPDGNGGKQGVSGQHPGGRPDATGQRPGSHDQRPSGNNDQRPGGNGQRPAGHPDKFNKVKLTCQRLPATLSALNSATESL